MSAVEHRYNTGYFKKILIMFFAAFLVLAIFNNIYAEGDASTNSSPTTSTSSRTTTDELDFTAKACKIYKNFSPILSFIILVVVITTAIAALFGKLSMAVVVTVMITAIVMKQAPTIVQLVTGDKVGSCVDATTQGST